MSKRESLGRYVHIIKKLRIEPARFNDLANHLEVQGEIDGYSYTISKRTFQRDIIDIRELYNIDIQFDRSQKVYFIDFDEGSEMDNRILEAFDTFNALNVTDRVSTFIHFEKRRPQGTENFNGLLHAITNMLVIQFTYHKFWDNNFSDRTIEPYALKEFRNRWYVVGKDLKDGIIKSFGLDRLSDFTITKTKFKKTNFDVNAHYRHCFGIIAPNAKMPTEVILSFIPFQGKYIKSMPLHESQQILIDNDEELRVKLTVFVTEDFVMEIVSHGERVKVLGPQMLADQIRSIHEEAVERYEE
jgi:predicted DNA-binding transcriptional regulator YafY